MPDLATWCTSFTKELNVDDIQKPRVKMETLEVGQKLTGEVPLG